MTKLNFKYSELNIKIKPSIMNTTQILSKAYNEASSLNIPSGFEYTSELKNLDSFISEVKEDLNYIYNWIDSSNKNLDNNLNEVNDLLKQIDDLEIVDRNKLVN